MASTGTKSRKEQPYPVQLQNPGKPQGQKQYDTVRIRRRHARPETMRADCVHLPSHRFVTFEVNIGHENRCEPLVLGRRRHSQCILIMVTGGVLDRVIITISRGMQHGRRCNCSSSTCKVNLQSGINELVNVTTAGRAGSR